ncbi:hypothetical protein E8E14_010639 [Neopestalotiopsis sp. 37M]|nr:hypothetical protein E8E14_010639 [Neopestalotiopsis sp. 37M]
MRFFDIVFVALAATLTSAAPAADGKATEKRAETEGNNLDALFQNYYAVPPAKRAAEALKRGEQIKRAETEGNNLDALFQNYYAVN